MLGKRRDKGGYGGNEKNEKVKMKGRGFKSALSLDVFSRAKQSTYDKRVVLEKKRNLAAGKVNKYRKVQKRLGDSVEVDDAFDPEKYEARLNEMEEKSGLPAMNKNDVFSKKGRRVGVDGDGGKKAKKSKKEGKTEKNVVADVETKTKETDASDSEDEFGGNIVEREGEGGDGSEGEDHDDTTNDDSKRLNKGWNKAVKEGLKKQADRQEKEQEMEALRKKWAEEDAGRKEFFKQRNDRRDKFRKKNNRGQPVMKHRVDKILEQLSREGQCKSV